MDSTEHKSVTSLSTYECVYRSEVPVNENQQVAR